MIKVKICIPFYNNFEAAKSGLYELIEQCTYVADWVYSYKDMYNLSGNESEAGNGFYISAILSDDGTCKGDGALISGDDYEIVGNIHEYKELLNN